MDLGIAGKVAFVAGGSKGMGRSAGRLLAEAGCKVGIVAQSQDAIESAVEDIRRDGGTAIGISADLTSRDDVMRAVAELTRAFGTADIVVGQTNDMQLGDLADVADEDFERCFHIFTMAQVYLARTVLPAMKEKGWGRIIHIGSVAGKEAETSHPHILHNTARPSTVAFLRTLANEVAVHGITVNVVAPGWIATPTLNAYLKDKLGLEADQADEWIRGTGQVPANRLGKPDEIGALVAFLASRWAGYITGEWIAVDGGRHKFSF